MTTRCTSLRSFVSAFAVIPYAMMLLPLSIFAQAEVLRTEGHKLVTQRNKDPKANDTYQVGISDQQGKMIVPFGKFSQIEVGGNLFYANHKATLEAHDLYSERARFDGLISTKGKLIPIDPNDIYLRSGDVVLRTRRTMHADGTGYNLEFLHTDLTSMETGMVVPVIKDRLKFSIAISMHDKQYGTVRTYDEGNIISFETTDPGTQLIARKEGDRIEQIIVGTIHRAADRYILTTADGAWLTDHHLRELTPRLRNIDWMHGSWLIGADSTGHTVFIDAQNALRPCTYYTFESFKGQDHSSSYFLQLFEHNGRGQELLFTSPTQKITRAQIEIGRILENFDRFELDPDNRTIHAFNDSEAAIFQIRADEPLTRLFNDRDVSLWETDTLTGLFKTTSTPPFDVYALNERLLAEQCDSIARLGQANVLWRNGEIALYDGGDLPLHFGDYSSIRTVLPQTVYSVARGDEKALIDHTGRFLLPWSASLIHFKRLPGIDKPELALATTPSQYVIYNSVSDSSHFFDGTVQLLSVPGLIEALVKGDRDYYLSRKNRSYYKQLYDRSGKCVIDSLRSIQKFERENMHYFIVEHRGTIAMYSIAMTTMIPPQARDDLFFSKVRAMIDDKMEANRVKVTPLGRKMNCGDEDLVFHMGELTGRSGRNYTGDLKYRKIIRTPADIHDVHCNGNRPYVKIQCMKCRGRGTYDTYRTVTTIVGERPVNGRYSTGVVQTIQKERVKDWSNIKCEECHGSGNAWYSLMDLLYK